MQQYKGKYVLGLIKKKVTFILRKIERLITVEISNSFKAKILNCFYKPKNRSRTNKKKLHLYLEE